MLERTGLAALARRCAPVARRCARLAVRTARRSLERAGGRRVVVGLGAAFLALAGADATALLADGRQGETVLISAVLVSAPAVGLLYGGARLPEADLHEDFHRTIAGWSVGGLVVAFAGVGLYHLQPDAGFVDPVQVVPVLLALGCFAGFAAGVHDARARTRARELHHRNRQLERTSTELESTIEELRSSNERLEQFAYAASHDLQEPLRMVSSYLQLLASRHDDDLDDAGEEYLEFAVDGADRMRAMVEGLLAYSRVESGSRSFERVDLEAVLAAVREDLQVRIERSDATLEVEALPTVRGDRDQLRQVFQNLLDNAVEYGGDEPPSIRVFVADAPEAGGEAGSAPDDGSRAHGDGRVADDRREPVTDDGRSPVTDAGREPVGDDGGCADREPVGDAARASVGDADRAPVSDDRCADGAAIGDGSAPGGSRTGDDLAARGTWTVAVSDDGIGIPPEHADSVFQVFERLHGGEAYEGTGIGLALCQRIVDRHGGDIWVESTPGGGSTFYVELPAAGPASDAGRQADRSAAEHEVDDTPNDEDGASRGGADREASGKRLDAGASDSVDAGRARAPESRAPPDDGGERPRAVERRRQGG